MAHCLVLYGWKTILNMATLYKDMTTHLEFLVEESSLKESLNQLLPKILPQEISFAIHSYRGKDDLLNKLPSRLQGYKAWMPSHYKIIVLIDEDRQDCKALKQKLEDIALNSGLTTKSKANSIGPYQVINRIVIEELEAWFFGDPIAICTAYPKVPASIGGKSKYRIPDRISGGTWEALERELQQAGYHAGGLSKNEASRKISEYMEPSRNSSASFQVFYRTLQHLI